MFCFEWWPMRSNRKPSTLYSLAHSTTESTMSFSATSCSVATFWQQVEVSTLPTAFRRW